MSFFDLDPTASKNLLDQATLHPITASDLQPGWWAGAWKGPITGLASTVNDAALLAGDAATPMLRSAARPVDSLFGTNLDAWLQGEQQKAVDNIKAWAPDPRTTGMIGNLAHGLFNVVPEALAGGPESAALLQGWKGTRGGMADGLNAGTALGVGAIDAVSTWAGMKLPMQALPKWGALGAVATGAAGNVATGAISRGATGAWLDANGYHDQASQYRVLDSTALLTDLLMGGGFGALAHYGPGAAAKFEAWRDKEAGKIQPSDTDAALAANNQLHLETDIAPGIPADAATRQAHVDAVNDALASLARDEPVTVRPEVTDGTFVDNPQAADFRTQAATVIEDHLGPEWRALEAELRARGLPTDEIDRSGVVRLAPAPAAPEAIPGAVMGNAAAVKIEGEYHPVRWALVDAGHVEATMAKGENQFRDRNRAASEAQINKIAGDPDYNLLTDSPIMDFGAPTLAKDGRIIGGNGRFAGVSRAYDKGTAGRYSKPLAENLRRYGIEPEAAAGMKKPVLVRVLQSDVDVRRAAIASNEGAGLRMSALEQAKVDAVRLGDMADVTVGETGELNTPTNRGAIRRWVGEFPDSERAALLDRDGQLSAEGATRLRNAVLFKAYGDSPTLSRLVESTDPGARNVAAALLRAAPQVAEARAAMEAGALHALDISPDIQAAVETLDQIRRDGGKVADYLNQSEMFGAGLSPEARTILQFMGENLRSAKAIGDMLTGYYERVREAGNPNQGDIFGAEPPTKADLLKAAVEGTGKSLQPGLAELPFGDKLPAGLTDADLQRLPAEARGQLRGMYEAAAARKPMFDEVNRAIAQALGGEYKAAPLKGGRRAVDKILADYKGDPTKIKDLLRASIIVDDPVRALAAVEELKARYEVLPQGFRNLFDETAHPVDGYRDAKMNVMIDGLPAEIQVHIPEMIAAKSEVHDLYEARSKVEREIGEGRATPEQLAHIEALNAEMRKAYDAAFEASASRLNSASDTGAPLRLADSAENGRGGSSSQAEQYGKPGTSPSDTGTPSTSKNSTEAGKAGNFIDFTSDGSLPDLSGVVKNATGDAGVAMVLADRPTMRIPTEGGGVESAAKAFADADAGIASAERESQGFEAAALCALRG